MSRQLNLRVIDEFAEQLERLSRRIGRPMAAVLEAVGAPALESAEEDAQFEADALAAWETYQLEGICLTADKIDAVFDKAARKARSVASKRDK
jgi:predicted transcriptional regulator